MTEATIQPAKLHVGCAGWSIPREAAPAFAAHGSHLERYCARLPAVEINSSFYRPHQPKTYARWADSVPSEFRFSVKLARAITHDARLAGVDEMLLRFAAEVGALGDKLGCVLVQLPPSLQFEQALAADFFARLESSLMQPLHCMLACEARHPSWFGEAATTLMRDAGITRVIADPAKGQPGPHVATTGNMYVRLHGAPQVYYSSYDSGYITRLAHDMAAKVAAGCKVWVIFDNTAAGAALPNALALLDAVAPLGLISRPG